MTSEDFVSVVVTGKNTETTIRECIQSILNVEYPRERFEVTYVDAKSTDRSLDIVKEIGSQHENLKYLIEPGLPGRGRNRGIKECPGQIIAFTDSDCIVDVSWLRNIVTHLTSQNEGVAGVGGPSMGPDSDPRFAKHVDNLWKTSFGSAGARNPAYYSGLRFVDHNPTCNSAYRRWVFDKVGFFNEYLPITEDEEFDTRIRRNGYRLLYADDVLVWHHRKDTLESFASQMFSYGFWRAHSGKKGMVPLKPLHFAPSSLVVYALILPLLGLLNFQLSAVPLAVYLVLGLTSGACMAWKSRDISCLVTLPALGLVEHTAYGLGFVSGLLANKQV